MSSVNAPYGLLPAYHAGGGALRTNIRPIASGTSGDIYRGSPVKIHTDGNLRVAAAAERIIGCFWGCTYTLNGRPQFSDYWPSGTVASDAKAVVYEDPMIVYAIQGDGTVNLSNVGEQADFTATGNGSTSTGWSTATLGVGTLAVGAQNTLSVVGLRLLSDNAWGDAYTQVLVRIVEHQFVASLNSF